MNLDKFLPSASDGWTWHFAQQEDVEAITVMADELYGSEVEGLITRDRNRMRRYVHTAVVQQSYDATTEQLIVAKEKTTGRLVAWAWCKRGNYTVYGPEECAEAQFLHIDLDLPLKSRIKLCVQAIQQWCLWCQICQVSVLISSSIRAEQTSFLRLHEQLGFAIRGSLAYKKL